MPSLKGYDNTLYCDICSTHIGYGEEYYYFEREDVVMCSDPCLEKYAIEYMEDNISYCDNE